MRAARGFRAPSIQGRLLFGNKVTVADTETVLSFESGTKLRLWEQRLHLNLAAFNYFMQDQQLTAVGGETNFNRLVNAESTVGRGVEAELIFAPMSALEISAGLSYNYTRIDDPNLAVQGCSAPCTMLDPPASVEGIFPSTVIVYHKHRHGLQMWRYAIFLNFLLVFDLLYLWTGHIIAEYIFSFTSLWNTVMIGF